MIDIVFIWISRWCGGAYVLSFPIYFNVLYFFLQYTRKEKFEELKSFWISDLKKGCVAKTLCVIFFQWCLLVFYQVFPFPTLSCFSSILSLQNTNTAKGVTKFALQEKILKNYSEHIERKWFMTLSEILSWGCFPFLKCC